MKTENIRIGLYKIHWKNKHGGGTSLCAIGVSRRGNLWIAPTNWVSPKLVDSGIAKSIKKLELIEK